jgi:hypothetical protein
MFAQAPAHPYFVTYLKQRREVAAHKVLARLLSNLELGSLAGDILCWGQERAGKEQPESATCADDTANEIFPSETTTTRRYPHLN